MIRIIAVSLLFIPGVIAALGIKLMRDTLFDEFHPIFLHTSLQFMAGLFMCAGGIAFIVGFIVHRDRKRQNLAKQNSMNEKDGEI